MLPANCLVVKCPHCKGEKELLQLMSGNTHGAEQWSDTKMIAPMLPSLCPVQRCPHCGRYYLLSRIKWWNRREGEHYSSETGWLSFEQAMEANKDIDGMSKRELKNVGLVTVFAYNDIIRKGERPSAIQTETFKQYVSQLMNTPGFFVGKLLLGAELYREIGEFEKCIATLECFEAENDFVKGIAETIANKAKAGDTEVFKIEG